jgi:flagellar motor switch protein FliN/FliY
MERIPMSETPETPDPDDALPAVAADAPAPAAGAIEQSSIDALLNQAQSALSSIDQPMAELPPGVTPFEFKDLSGTIAANEAASLDLLRDVQLDLKIELGRTQMHLEDVLRLKQGAVVTLDKLAGDPVDIYANGRLIARGEVLVLNDNFCVRVAELIAGDDAA